ncbi:hypothetical protein CYG49_03005 [Candidatus Saccharibacteria bacterium]|nr:MAG: hypothetical protein CYG49_03005 [Candidatus Saccharibacteria bacterium]
MPVNNTIIEHILNVVAPHHCVGCNEEGSLLCSVCFEAVTEGPTPLCCFCSAPSAMDWLCTSCRTIKKCDAVWVVGSYENELKNLVHAFKFERAKAARTVIAKLLLTTLPYIPTTTIVVSVPTTPQHTRQRGYDHTCLVASLIATERGYKYQPLLKRISSTRQLGKDRKERFIQAEEAFAVVQPLPRDAQILLIDDVITTGATVQAAARCLKEAGAARVFVLALAHENLK